MIVYFLAKLRVSESFCSKNHALKDRNTNKLKTYYKKITALNVTTLEKFNTNLTCIGQGCTQEGKTEPLIYVISKIRNQAFYKMPRLFSRHSIQCPHSIVCL